MPQGSKTGTPSVVKISLAWTQSSSELVRYTQHWGFSPTIRKPQRSHAISQIREKHA